jgi:DNA-binding MarR family transcriptional regulator
MLKYDRAPTYNRPDTPAAEPSAKMPRSPAVPRSAAVSQSAAVTRSAARAAAPPRRAAEVARVDDVRHGNIGRLLLDAFRYFNERTIEHLHRHGLGDIRPVHTQLLRNLDAEGTRITALGHRTNMTKQAVGQLIVECERLGYVQRTVDPADSRAKIVRFTRKGEKFLGVVPKVLAASRADLAALIGAARLEALEAALRDLVGAAGATARLGRKSKVPRAPAGHP